MCQSPEQTIDCYIQVHSHPEIAAAIQAAMAITATTRSSSNGDCGSGNGLEGGSSKIYMVWGSSTGWLALYAGLAYCSWRVVGIELLPVLVKISQEIVDNAGLTGMPGTIVQVKGYAHRICPLTSHGTSTFVQIEHHSSIEAFSKCKHIQVRLDDTLHVCLRHSVCFQLR